MTNSTMTISALVNEAKKYLLSTGYCKSTIQRYSLVWEKLFHNCSGAGIFYYSYDVCISSISSIYKIPKHGKLTQHQTFCIRTVKLLDDIYRKTKVGRCFQPSGAKVTKCFSVVLDEYLESQGIAGIKPKTIHGKSIQMTRFLNYLVKEHELSNISLLTTDMILSYVKELKGTYARSTVSGILFTLRDFLLFLYQRQITIDPLHQLFPVIFSNKFDRLPSYYDEDEIRKILESANRDTPIGKRDYLILLLAVQLGIRAGDIRRMELKEIHWDRSTIEFIQQKTGNPIQLPLPDNIKYALIEYIRDSRPRSNSPYIFLRTRAPFEPYVTNNVFHYVITGYMDNASINYSDRRHGLHSMRHSLASNLLRNNTPYPVIAGILGHSNPNTTRHYLSIDIEELRSVALEVPYEG